MKKKLRSDFNTRQYMLSDDFELYYYSDLNFRSVGDHSHPYTEVYLFEEGEVSMEIEGEAFPLHTGDVIIVPPGVRHRAVIHSGDKPYRRFVFWLSEAFCRRLRKEAEDYLYLIERAQREGRYIRHLDLMEANTLRGKLFTLLEELQTARFGRDAQIGLYVRDLLLFLGRCVYERERPGAARSLTAFQQLTDYISQHLEEELSLEALGRALYLSPFYISHLMRENTGVSLHAYITKKRLNACCEAMRAGSSAADSALRFGFQNYSGFYRAFKKEYGLSPAEWLKEKGVRKKP